MQIQNNTSQALDMYKQSTSTNDKTKEKSAKNVSLEEIINNSAARVTISMNAQSILFEMNTASMTKNNTLGQSGTEFKSNQLEVLNFLAGKETDGGMSLKNIGYEGKPILELSSDEAKDLVSEDGFFGVKNTSDRVAGFVLNFAGDDLDILQKGRDGVVQGFEEAKKMFGGELPDISYKTQERTLALIDEKMNSLKGKS